MWWWCIECRGLEDEGMGERAGAGMEELLWVWSARGEGSEGIGERGARERKQKEERRESKGRER